MAFTLIHHSSGLLVVIEGHGCWCHCFYIDRNIGLPGKEILPFQDKEHFVTICSSFMAYELKENQHAGKTYSTQNNMGPICMVLAPLMFSSTRKAEKERDNSRSAIILMSLGSDKQQACGTSVTGIRVGTPRLGIAVVQEDQV